MPRSLTFTHNAQSFECQLVKIDRRQLYGSVSVETRDSNKAICRVATLAEDGKTLIPKGGTALGYVNPEGEWVSRATLQAVALDGEPLEEVESSFDSPIDLSQTSSVEHFLNHSVRLSYQLKATDTLPNEVLQQLKAGTLFEFGFSYRGGVGHDPAFVMSDENDNIWLLITEVNDVQFVALEQAAICAGEALIDEVEDGEQDNSLDFGML